MPQIRSFTLILATLLLSGLLACSPEETSQTTGGSGGDGGGGGGGGGSCVAEEVAGNGEDDDCDGLTDETKVELDSSTTTASDIQTLLDNASSGDVIELVADGPIVLNSTLTISTGDLTLSGSESSPVHFKGDGSLVEVITIAADNVVLKYLEVSVGSGDLITQVTNQTGTQLIDIAVHDSTGDECIQLKQCNDCLLNRVEAYNCAGDGINFSNSSSVTIKNSTIYNSLSTNGYLQLSEVNGASLDNIEIKQNGASGDRDGSGAGIYVYKPYGTHAYSNLSIHDNVFDNSGTGQAALSVYKYQTVNTMTVTSSSFADNTGIAFYLQKNVGTDSEVDIDGLSITNHSEGLITNTDSQICSVSNSSGSNNTSTSLAGCTDGGGNNFQ